MPCPGISLHFLEPEYTVIVSKKQSGIIAQFKNKVISDHMDELMFGIYSEDGKHFKQLQLPNIMKIIILYNQTYNNY